MTKNNLATQFLAKSELASGEASAVPIRAGTDSWSKVRLEELFDATRVDDSAAHLLARISHQGGSELKFQAPTESNTARAV